MEITRISAGTTNTQKDCEPSQSATQEKSMCITNTFMHTQTHICMHIQTHTYAHSHPHAQ